MSDIEDDDLAAAVQEEDEEHELIDDPDLAADDEGDESEDDSDGMDVIAALDSKIQHIKLVDAKDTYLCDSAPIYAMTPLIIARYNALVRGAQPYVQIDSKNPIDIIRAEIEQRKCPLAPLDDNHIKVPLDFYSHFPGLDILKHF